MPTRTGASARKRVLRIVRTTSACATIWGYTVVAPLGCAGFGVLAFLWRRDPVERTRRLQRAMAAAYRGMHHWTRWIRVVDFDPRDEVEGIPGGACVVIANHPTLMDITAITAMLGGASTIAKPEFFRRRLLRGMLRSTGHIEGPGSEIDQERTRVLIERATDMLSHGFKLVVFPEGTRSSAECLRPFGRTPFEIACRAGVPVVALTVRSTPPYLTKGGSIYHPPVETSRLRLGLLDVFDPAAFDGDSRRLRSECERRYRAWWSGVRDAEPAADAREGTVPRALTPGR